MTCAGCNQPPAPNSKWCTEACRKRTARANGGTSPSPSPVTLVPRPAAAGSCHAATTRELADVDRLDTALGQAALVLAERIDANLDTGSALAAAVKQLQVTLAAATAGAGGVGLTRLEQMRVRRDQKRA